MVQEGSLFRAKQQENQLNKIKKVNENMEFREILNPSSEELKNIIGAKTLAAHKINNDITCLYDLDKNGIVIYKILDIKR